MPERLFISVDIPGNGRDHNSTRAVRSWVTKVQHARQPRHQLDKPSPDDSKIPRHEHMNQRGHETISDTASSSVNASAGSVPPSTWSWEAVDPSCGPSPVTRRRIQAHVARRQHKRRREAEREKNETFDTTSPTSSGYTSPLPTPLLEEAPVSSPSTGLQDPTDSLDIYARGLNTSVPAIWAHYLWQEREHGRAFGEHYPQFQGWGSKYLHPLIISNRAFLATTILFTGAHLRFLQGQNIGSPAILQLRSLAHKYVQAAIDDEVERLTDSTMLSVIKLALFEAVFGVRAACQVHMQAVAKMVHLRQGLLNLGMDGYTARLLVWFDANLSDIVGSPRYLTEEVARAPAIKAVESDEEAFRLGVTGRVGLKDDSA